MTRARARQSTAADGGSGGGQAGHQAAAAAAAATTTTDYQNYLPIGNRGRRNKQGSVVGCGEGWMWPRSLQSAKPKRRAHAETGGQAPNHGLHMHPAGCQITMASTNSLTRWVSMPSAPLFPSFLSLSWGGCVVSSVVRSNQSLHGSTLPSIAPSVCPAPASCPPCRRVRFQG